jgi:hypothetical protein
MSTGSSDPPLLMSSPARASRPRSGERALRLPPACAHSRYELRELHWVANLCGLRAPLRAFGSNRTHNLDRIQKVETSSKNTRAPTTAKSKALEHRPPGRAKPAQRDSSRIHGTYSTPHSAKIIQASCMFHAVEIARFSRLIFSPGQTFWCFPAPLHICTRQFERHPRLWQRTLCTPFIAQPVRLC